MSPKRTRLGGKKAIVATPAFRSMSISRPAHERGVLKTAKSFTEKDHDVSRSSPEKLAAMRSSPADKIVDKDFFFRRSPERKEGDVILPNEKADNWDTSFARSNWLVNDKVLRLVPSYYPLEKSSRFVTGASAGAIASKISDCCRIMSIQANFNDDTGTAVLKTSEHVDIHISLWRGTGPKYPDCVIVEAQRISGDAVTYHKYCRLVLDAADGDFDVEEFLESEECETERCLVAGQMIASKKSSMGNISALSDHANSFLALEIATSLIRKDCMDARQLGLESLCLLTDPARAGIDTALIASRVVLVGSILEHYCDDDEFLAEELGIREAILSLVQFGRLTDDGSYMEDMESDDERDDAEDEPYNNLLHNLALAVLANALEVLQNNDPRTGTSIDEGSSSAYVADEFLSEEISSRDLLSTLINSLGSAERKPHEACLSARCLSSLCAASEDAWRRSREMNLKSMVATAMDVGRRMHVKLETETEKVLTVLENVADDW